MGVDFGTYASGFAYSADGGQHVRLFTTYPDQPAPYPKALTAILYRHGAPLHWGWTAQRVWMGLSPKDRCVRGQHHACTVCRSHRCRQT